MTAICATSGIRAGNTLILTRVKRFTTPFALYLPYLSLSFLFRLHTSLS